jgi:hypothetical protein
LFELSRQVFQRNSERESFASEAKVMSVAGWTQALADMDLTSESLGKQAKNLKSMHGFENDLCR